MIRPLLALTAALVLLAGCVNATDDSQKSAKADITASGGNGTHSVNGSIHVPAGQPSGEIDTVNGSIHVDANAVLSDANTVNGSIGIGAHATAKSLNTVNGGITLDDGAHVSGAVSAVNGTLTLKSGADVAGQVANVNGDIVLESAHVAGGIRTVSGDINVGSNSQVEGGILVQRQTGSWFHWGNSKPKIVIGPGAVVQGDLRFERQVALYVSDTATIGPVTGATPIKFSGPSPPG
jgi:cytoskeletal protein CcmA (bactofilin family)